MVLGELGETITSALRKVTGSRDVDEALLNEVLDEIVNALVASDVEVALAEQFRVDVKQDVNFQNLPLGVNKRKVIQKVSARRSQRRHTAFRLLWLCLCWMVDCVCVCVCLGFVAHTKSCVIGWSFVAIKNSLHFAALLLVSIVVLLVIVYY